MTNATRPSIAVGTAGTKITVTVEGGLEGVEYALWDAAGWHRDYSPPAWRNRAIDEQKRRG
jgi:hypothetical protein